MIVGGPWIGTMAKLGKPQQTVAIQLLRLLSVVPNRTGHWPDVGSEYARRKIVSTARFGVLADISVPCSKCGTQAKLGYWYRMACMSREEVAKHKQDLLGKLPPEDNAYCYTCPGAAYRAALDSIDSLPGPRRLTCV